MYPGPSILPRPYAHIFWSEMRAEARSDAIRYFRLSVSALPIAGRCQRPLAVGVGDRSISSQPELNIGNPAGTFSPVFQHTATATDYELSVTVSYQDRLGG